MLRKAHATAKLRWRGHIFPGPIATMLKANIPRSLRARIRQIDHHRCACGVQMVPALMGYRQQAEQGCVVGHLSGKTSYF